MNIKTVAILLSLFVLSGCAPIIDASIIGDIKRQSQRIDEEKESNRLALELAKEKLRQARQENEMKEKEAYRNYVLEMEKINLEREKANLPTRKIDSFEEWKAITKKR